MFNSRNKKYRDPTGAVPVGQAIHFRISLPRELACSQAYLLVEQDQGKTFFLGMFWCGMNGKTEEWWECHFTPEAPGLYFYHFECRTCFGHRQLSRGPGGNAVFTGIDRWQLTVYAGELQTPGWLAGGVMYQIFPDRFYRSGKEKTGVPGDREMHSDWGEQPQWRPNAQGHITNSDFFGGDLKGIEQKLPYLKSLGVTCLYFNPIFESHSNHRYDTADYSKIDPLLGTEEDFVSLCAAAKELGIRILLDGVFSHTGSDSVYFNHAGRYQSLGAYQSQQSPYYSWYTFHQWPNSYDCWWNFSTLPNVRETQPEYNEYINGKEGIVRKWLKAGASGWRLDVADELPDEFLDNLTAAVKAEDPEALVLGEVWEDATNKTAYGVRRRYLLGGQLDTVMNYPFRDAILHFLLAGESERFREAVEELLENYPSPCIPLLMNHIGTHDTERAITVLAGEPVGTNGREWQSAHRLSPEQRELGKKRLKLATLLQFLLPGVPCIYYGDEAGLEGYKDPFNRGCFPWGHEDQELISWYSFLGKLRGDQRELFAKGDFEILYAKGDLLFFRRSLTCGEEKSSLLLTINRGFSHQGLPPEIDLPLERSYSLSGDLQTNSKSLPPLGHALLFQSEKTTEKSDEKGLDNPS